MSSAYLLQSLSKMPNLYLPPSCHITIFTFCIDLDKGISKDLNTHNTLIILGPMHLAIVGGIVELLEKGRKVAPLIAQKCHCSSAIPSFISLCSIKHTHYGLLEINAFKIESLVVKKKETIDPLLQPEDNVASSL